MKTLSKALLCAGLLLAGHGSFAQGSAAPAAPAASASTAASAPADGGAPAARLAARQVPKLVIRWDCGECTKNDKVPPLIEQTYQSQAAAQGYAVSDAETAEIVITEYRQRPPAMRVMFGIMAGKDVLTTRLNFRGKDYVVSDYAANIFQGMNSLCDAVAQAALKQLVASLQP